jgi:hypothetical protein
MRAGGICHEQEHSPRLIILVSLFPTGVGLLLLSCRGISGSYPTISHPASRYLERPAMYASQCKRPDFVYTLLAWNGNSKPASEGFLHPVIQGKWRARPISFHQA